jgi:hypothetical protein
VRINKATHTEVLVETVLEELMIQKKNGGCSWGDGLPQGQELPFCRWKKENLANEIGECEPFCHCWFISVAIKLGWEGRLSWGVL